MIRGIGIDSVEIARCSIWQQYTALQLARIFSPQEIMYCFAHDLNTTERLAARFAAKEATYKALCAAYPTSKIPFLTLCRCVEVIQKPGSAPTLSIDWSLLQQHYAALMPLTCHVSLTHTDIYATAIVILEENRQI